MRYDLSFFLCCCKSFLGSGVDDDNTPDFYDLLDVDRDASADEIKKAYKRKSLQMHPDKLAQRGRVVTEDDQARFTRMKEAYEVLSDPHKRETYDSIGERGMKWIEEPFSIDPQELAHNFAKSSLVDRSKIFAIFVGLAVAVLILPLLVCLHIDGAMGDAVWMATLFPLWLWNFFVLFYHARVIMMGPIQRPEHIPQEEWTDPLPMKNRVFSLIRFLLLFFFQILASMKLDALVVCRWAVIFIPLYLWELTTLYKKWPLAYLRIVTVEDLETAMGKPFLEFTMEEKELIGKRYSVVSSIHSPEYEAAQKLKLRARKDVMKCVFRIMFIIILVIQLDASVELNWWIVFTPYWLMTLLICVTNYQAFSEVQLAAAEKDPSLFGLSTNNVEGLDHSDNSNTNAINSTNNYGSVGEDGVATTEATSTTVGVGNPQSPLSDEERELLKAEVLNGGSKMCSKCCSQAFLLILVCLIVAKLQGAGFSSLWIISPFLFASGIILCCLGLAIFGISEVPSEGDPGHFVGLVDGDVAGEKDTTIISPSIIINHDSRDAEMGGGENAPSQQTAQQNNTTELVQEQASEDRGTMELRELD